MTKRHDGRSPEDLRPVKLTRNYLDFAEGSCLVEFGRTRVLCAASVETGVPFWMRGSGKGWVTAEYSMLPRSTVERTRREATAGKQSGRTQEIQRLIGRSLRAVVDLAKLGEVQIIVDCDCLIADGGTRTASITGGFVALADALAFLVASGRLAEAPLVDHVAAVSVGMVGGRACLDLDYVEDSSAQTDMNLVMTGSGGFVEIQGTAEGAPFSGRQLQEMLALGAAGVSRLVALQQAALKL